jgi:superoxide dismutase, Cu-Zn family
MIRIALAIGLMAFTAPALAAPKTATTTLVDPTGKVMGTATVRDVGHGLQVKITAKGMEPGERAAHLHAVGTCEGPKFTTAGPHWNPDGKMHGRDNPMGSHAGDLPNLKVNAKGRAKLTYIVHGATMAGLLDADGGAVIFHAKPDDYKTDPAGAAGDRIACGILKGR